MLVRAKKNESRTPAASSTSRTAAERSSSSFAARLYTADGIAEAYVQPVRLETNGAVRSLSPSGRACQP